MAIRQTRIFIPHGESFNDWAETAIGRIIKPVIVEFAGHLEWFWFSRYICSIGMQGEDIGDCNFANIPNTFKQSFPGLSHPGHRSLRFRFEIADQRQVEFEARVQLLVEQQGYAISDVREYNKVGDAGGNRFLGVENQQHGRDIQRAQLVTNFYHIISQVVIDSIVGPDQDDRYHIENNDSGENPNGSTFESLHHLFCNITNVPVSVLFNTNVPPSLIGTYWGRPKRQRSIDRNGETVHEVYLTY